MTGPPRRDCDAQHVVAPPRRSVSSDHRRTQLLLTLTVFPVAASAAPRAVSPVGAVAPVRGGPPQPTPPAHTESPTPAQGRRPRELDHGPQRDQAEEAQPDGSSAMAAAKARGHRVVVDDRSTVAATTYANPDGSMTRTTVPPGVFHLDHGRRVRTDLSVVPSSDATYPLQVPGAARPLHLGRGAAHLLAWDLPGGTVTATSDHGDTSGAPSADSSGAVSWPGSPHRSLRVVPTLTGFDGQLVLQDAEAGSTFTVTLHDPQHVLAGAGAATKTGGWSIPGDDGTSALVLDAPHAYETTVVTGKALPLSTTARLTVTHHGDDYDVTTTVDPQWLSTARFPVVVDPRTHFDTGEWGYTNAGPVPDCPVTDANGGNAGNCFQGHDLDYVADGGYGNYRIQIRPDLSGIPANAQVLSATLWMNATATAPYAQQLLLLCNSTGYYGEISGDTWNNTAGGHLGGTCTSTWSSGSGWQSFDFTGNAQTYVRSGTNSGLVLRENCEYSNCTEYTHFTSGWDGGYGSPWPQASITWAAPPQTAPIPVTIAAGDSSLTTAWNYPNDDGGNPVLSYNVYTTDTTTNQLVGGTYQNVAAGTYSKSYTASDGITNGHNYYSYILACNDHGCGPGAATPASTPSAPPGAPTRLYPGTASISVAETLADPSPSLSMQLHGTAGVSMSVLVSVWDQNGTSIWSSSTSGLPETMVAVIVPATALSDAATYSWSAHGCTAAGGCGAESSRSYYKTASCGHYSCTGAPSAPVTTPYWYVGGTSLNRAQQRGCDSANNFATGNSVRAVVILQFGGQHGSGPNSRVLLSDGDGGYITLSQASAVAQAFSVGWASCNQNRSLGLNLVLSTNNDRDVTADGGTSWAGLASNVRSCLGGQTQPRCQVDHGGSNLTPLVGVFAGSDVELAFSDGNVFQPWLNALENRLTNDKVSGFVNTGDAGGCRSFANPAQDPATCAAMGDNGTQSRPPLDSALVSPPDRA